MDPRDLAAAGGFELLAAHAPVAERVLRDDAEMRRFTMDSMADSLRGEPSDHLGGYKVERGVALIPVAGSLVPRGPVWMTRYGVTSYEAIRSELRRAAADDTVSSIVLMVDSSGGYVSGVDVTGDAILAARQKKPVIAVVEGMAASAAYWLASQADQIIASSVADLGSIGVILMHVDVSRAMDAAGLKVTLIHAGSQKADLNPYAPLPDAVKADLQRKLEKSRMLFASAVVNGRGNPALDMKTVLATEAGIFAADDAVAMGLADRIGSLDQLLDTMATAPPARRPLLAPGRLVLHAGAPALTPLPGAASVEAPPAKSAVQPEAPQNGKEAERARIAAIMAHAYVQGAGRALAEHLAYVTDTPVAEALQALDASAADNARLAQPPRRLTLAEEMAADIQPRIGMDGGSDPRSLSPAQRGAMVAAQVMGKDVGAAILKADGPRSRPMGDLTSLSAEETEQEATGQAWSRPL